mgnify:CR=1 FL=1
MPPPAQVLFSPVWGQVEPRELADWILADRLPVRLHLLVPAVENSINGEATRPGDVMLSAMPLFHTAGNVMEVMGVLTNGAALIKAISFDAHKMLELLEHEQATILSAVPTMVIAMLQRHEECGCSFNTSALRFVISGGTPIRAGSG